MYYVGYKGNGRAEIYLSSKEFTESFHPENVRFAFGGYRTRKQAERVAMYQNYGLDNDWNKRIVRFA
jgi:hypothetical protein